MLGQLQERRAGGREFHILGDATEKQLRAPNDDDDDDDDDDDAVAESD